MALDRISEMVAHFIGIFETAEDGARLRELAEGFRHTTDPHPDFDPEAIINHVLRAPYEHEGSHDGLSKFQFSKEAPPPAPQVGTSGSVEPFLHSITSFDMAALPRLKADFPVEEQTLLYAGLPPGSIAYVGHQFNVLVDHDLMVGAGTLDFVAPEIFDAALMTLTQVADDLTPTLIGNPFDIIAQAAGFGQSLGAQYTALSQSAPDAAQVTLIAGADAFGLTINGTPGAVAPTLDELMPAYLQPDPVDEDTPDAAPTGVGGSAAAASAVFDVEDGHDVLAGGNFAINETIVAFSAVDAPVIAVMGDAISTISISQVNVIYNFDVGAGLTEAADVALNVATIALASSQPPAGADEDGDDDQSPQPSDVFPEAWAVTQIDGDLLMLNWVHQYNFLSDHDRAEVTFSGEDSFIGFGGNIVLNQTMLLEFSGTYDLIIVGGQMIDMALISQTNVLLDNDVIISGGGWPTGISGGDNLALNAATIDMIGIDSYTAMQSEFAQAGRDLADGAGTISADLAQSDYFAGTPFLNVLYISGDLITVTSISQTNIMGDADQVGVALAGLEQATDGPVTVTTGSNAVVNIASIMEHGMDSVIMVGGEVYDHVLLYQAELIETDADPLGVAQMPLANEAVAFLADDMVEDAPVTDAVFAGQIDTSTTSVDVMGGVVA